VASIGEYGIEAGTEVDNVRLMCGRCYDEVDVLYAANCDEKPEALAGQPIGQYHCPDCGAMVMAGIPHPQLCKVCMDRRHPGFDGNVERR
jgi:hypothetical protein